MTFSIDIKVLHERAAKRAATLATVATLLPITDIDGSKVAVVAGHARDSANRLTVAPPQLIDPLTRRYSLAQADTDAAHAGPWDGAAIARFVARMSLFMRRGVNAIDADDLAERLHLRDVQSDDRVLCLECKHLAGRRCGNANAAGVGRDLPTAMVMQLQRCPGFDR
jgi:hypothetical protein